MLKFSILLLIFVAAVFAEDFKADDGLVSELKIGAKNLTDFLRGNPKVELVREFTTGPTPKAVIVYRLGNRVNGDRLVASATARQQWSAPQDIVLTLSYPRTGTGAVITYVEIRVDQSSNVGRAYVVTGGINQRQITINVEAINTLYFEHLSQIYGY